jgi:hypothetical protein
VFHLNAVLATQTQGVAAAALNYCPTELARFAPA